jgi:hypothetical protein
MLAAGAASAERNSESNAALKGSYPFNETIIGAVSPASPGQTACGQTLTNPVAQQLTLTNQGIWTFDGKGNLEINDTGVLTVTPGTNQYMDVSYSAASCAGTYAVSGNKVSMKYTCGVAGGVVQFDVIALGLITPSSILVAVPPAAGNTMRIVPEYFAAGGARTLIACTVIGENTHIALK